MTELVGSPRRRKATGCAGVQGAWVLASRCFQLEGGLGDGGLLYPQCQVVTRDQPTGQDPTSQWGRGTPGPGDALVLWRLVAEWQPSTRPASAPRWPRTCREATIAKCSHEGEQAAGLPAWRPVPRGPVAECFGPESGNPCPADHRGLERLWTHGWSLTLWCRNSPRRRAGGGVTVTRRSRRLPQPQGKVRGVHFRGCSVLLPDLLLPPPWKSEGVGGGTVVPQVGGGTLIRTEGEEGGGVWKQSSPHGPQHLFSLPSKPTLHCPLSGPHPALGHPPAARGQDRAQCRLWTRRTFPLASPHAPRMVGVACCAWAAFRVIPKLPP